MGRQLRRVTSDWEHPKKEDGNLHPLINEYYGDALMTWIKNNKLWEEGTHPDLKEYSLSKVEYPFYSMWGGNAPDVDYYQKKKYSEKELTHIQLYENTSEGTPLSPVFKADELDKLCEWAETNATTFADFKATKKEWMDMLSDGLVYHKRGNVMFM